MSSDRTERAEAQADRSRPGRRGILASLRTLVGWPRGAPIKWRIAGVSALLTMLILIGFAAVVGRLATNQIRSDFRTQLENAAGEVAFQYQTASARGQRVNLEQAAMPSGAAIRIVDSFGRVIDETGNASSLGPPSQEVREIGDLQVATALLIPSSLIGAPATYVQFARDSDNLDATVSRVWIFLGSGVVVGTLLAAFAGLMVAGRAMRPIAALTAAARDIAATRDPSMKIPKPASEDEVGELARTLEDMLGELDAARTETQQAMQRQREFVADASHELRTPLTSILANLEMLEEHLEAGIAASANGQRSLTAEDSHAAADSALRSSRRMGRLISDLLILARADAGREATMAPCDLSAIACEAAAELTPLASSHPIRVDTDGPVPVIGNADDLHRLVLNLLDNAVRHTPDGTRVELRVGSTPAGKARIDVSDNGPGLPVDGRDHLFERFARADGPADRNLNAGGSGLGLAIVRSVALTHGGTVVATDSPSGGALFIVEIPLAQGRATGQTNPKVENTVL